jgi:hypothetical protein
MSTMTDRDKVISESAQCAAANSSEVGAALNRYVTASTRDEAAFAEGRLRVALVAQSAGHEIGAHDGSTLRARVEHACRALEAWDGRSMNAAPPKMAVIDLGATVVRGSYELAKILGWSCYVDSLDAKRHLEPAHADGFGQGHVREIAQALSEGLSGDAALLRAIAIVRLSSEQADVDRRRAEISATEERAANAALAAARTRR